MIFGSVINENLNDEIIVTVIATGFSDDIAPVQAPRPTLGGRHTAQPAQPVRQEPVQQQQEQVRQVPQDDQLDIPTFLRNRRNRNQ